MSRFEPIVRSWSAISRSLPQFAPARRPHARRRPMLECLEGRSLLSTVTLTVNSLADASPPKHVTTLREAITKADANPANSYTGRRNLVHGVIDLTTELPHLTDNISINGNGITLMHSPGTPQFSLFTTGFVPTGGSTTSATVNISGMTFLNGNAQCGGAINNYGSLTITNDTFLDNSASSGGGAINEVYSFSTLTASNDTFIDNSSGSGGGAISINGSLTASNDTFIDNSAAFGGALATAPNGVCTIDSTVFANNSSSGCGGAISNMSALTITNSTFSNNYGYSGGAIFNWGNGSLTVNESTFLKNSCFADGKRHHQRRIGSDNQQHVH